MNEEEIIKYINTNFKNIVDDKIQAFEQSVIKIIILKKHTS